MMRAPRRLGRRHDGARAFYYISIIDLVSRRRARWKGRLQSAQGTMKVELQLQK